MRSDYLPAPDPADPSPLFLKLSWAISADIQRGRLRPGERLPGSRALAEKLGCNRNTVLAALTELESQGWVRSEAARGCFVDVDLPGVSPPARVTCGRAGFDLPDPPDNVLSTPPAAGVLPMLGGRPDLRLLPLAELGRAIGRAMRGPGRRLLDYGDPRGLPALRAALMLWLAEKRGLSGDADDLLVTRGSQQALHLCARGLLRPGARVAVEALGYRPAWAAFREAGATLVPIPVDEDGIRVDVLAAEHARAPVSAVYVTPHHQYPTGALLSPERRAALLQLAARGRFPIFEDDYDHEFHYRGRPVLPLASQDTAGLVVYIGTLSKAFAPGLRLGFVSAPRAVLDRLSALRVIADRQGDAVVEHAIAELLTEGVIQRHVRKATVIYRRRRDLLLERLDAELPGLLTVSPPAGGMALWAASRLNPESWAHGALTHGVAVQPGAHFSFDGKSTGHLRLGFAGLDEADLIEAVRRLRKAAVGLEGLQSAAQSASLV